MIVTPSVPATRPAPDDHPGWCVQHSPAGCLGAAYTVPGTLLRVWLSAPSAGDTRLVVDGPGGCGELPVQI